MFQRTANSLTDLLDGTDTEMFKTARQVLFYIGAAEAGSECVGPAGSQQRRALTLCILTPLIT